MKRGIVLIILSANSVKFSLFLIADVSSSQPLRGCNERSTDGRDVAKIVVRKGQNTCASVRQVNLMDTQRVNGKHKFSGEVFTRSHTVDGKV